MDIEKCDDGLLKYRYSVLLHRYNEISIAFISDDLLKLKIAYSEVRMADPSFYLDCGSYQGEPLDTATNNGNWTECSPIRSVIIRVINKIGRPRSGSMICQSQV